MYSTIISSNAINNILELYTLKYVIRPIVIIIFKIKKISKRIWNGIINVGLP
jgi:hypothetical protein